MPRSHSDEALILRTYDVGEADRFCLMLTKNMGRISARAHGVRKLTSRRGVSVLALEKVHVELEDRKGTFTIANVSGMESYGACVNNLAAFGAAEQGIELILALVHEGDSDPQLFELVCDFLKVCAGGSDPLLLPAFTLKLLSHLGLLPLFTSSSVSHRSFTDNDELVYSYANGGFALADEDPAGKSIDRSVHRLLSLLPRMPLNQLPVVDAHVVSDVSAFTQLLVSIQLGGSLKVPSVAARLAGSTPTSYVSWRVS